MSPAAACGDALEAGFPRMSGDEPQESIDSQVHRRFPRMSGDEPVHHLPCANHSKVSPRERG